MAAKSDVRRMHRRSAPISAVFAGFALVQGALSVWDREPLRLALALLWLVVAWLTYQRGTKVSDTGVVVRRGLKARSVPWTAVRSVVPPSRYDEHVQLRLVSGDVLVLAGVPAGRADDVRTLAARRGIPQPADESPRDG